MAYSALTSSSQYTVIYIEENTNDDWESSAPFPTLISASDTGYGFGTIASASFYTHKLLENVLASVGQIDRSIDIFRTNNKVISGEVEVKGIGGFASSGDFSFSLENSANNIVATKLLGHKIVVKLGNGTTMSESTNVETVFVGKIYEVKPQRKFLDFVCRSNSELWNKEIGTETGFDVDSIYNSLIYPIIYGDYSDENGFMSLVPNINSNTGYLSSLITGDKKINIITELVVFDTSSERSYGVLVADANIEISADNTDVALNKSISAYITADVYAWQNEIKVWAPDYSIFELDSNSYTFDEHSQSVTGSIYYDSKGNYFEVLEYTGKLCKFSIFTSKYTEGENVLESVPFTLTKFYGQGPATLDIIYRTPIIRNDFTIETIKYLSVAGSNIIQKSINAPIEPVIVNLNGELLELYFVEDAADSIGHYAYSTFKCIRAVEGTVTGTHSTGDIIMLKKRASFIGLTMKLPVINLSGLEYSLAFFAPTSVTRGPDYVGPTQISMEKSAEDDGFYSFIVQYTDPDLDTSAPFVLSSAINKNFSMNFVLPKIGIEGSIVEMFLLGSYKVEAVIKAGESAKSKDFTLVLGKGGSSQPWRSSSVHHFGDDPDNAEPGTAPDLVTVDRLAIAWKDKSLNTIENLNKNKFLHGVGTIQPQYVSDSDENPFENPYVLCVATSQGISEHICFFSTVSGTSSISGGGGGILPPRLINIINDEAYRLNYPYQVKMIQTDTEIIKEADWEGACVDFSALNSTNYYLFFENKKVGTTEIVDSTFVFKIVKPGFLIKFNVDVLKNRFWARGSGRVFDSSITYYNGLAGNLITNPVSIIEDLARSELGLTDNELDEISFDTAYSSRNTWQSSASIFGDKIYFKDVVDMIARENGLIVSETNDGKLKVSILDVPTSTSGLREILNSELLLDSSGIARYGEAYTVITDLITDLTCNYQYNNANDTFGSSTSGSEIPGIPDMTENALDILDEERRATIDLNTIRNKNTVNYFSFLLMQYHNRPLRILDIYGTLNLRNIGIGDWCIFQNDDYILGTDSKVYLCVNSKLRPKFKGELPEVSLKLIELDAGGYGCAIYESVLDDNEIQEVTSGLDEIQETTECT